MAVTNSYLMTMEEMVTAAGWQQRLWKFSREEKCTCREPDDLLDVMRNARSAVDVVSVADYQSMYNWRDQQCIYTSHWSNLPHLHIGVVSYRNRYRNRGCFAKPNRTETADLCFCIDGSVLKWSSSGVLNVNSRLQPASRHAHSYTVRNRTETEIIVFCSKPNWNRPTLASVKP